VIFRALVGGHLLNNGLRTLTTIAAIALGVAIVLAIDLANATALGSFARSVDLVSTRVDLQIAGIDRGFDERVLPRVRTTAGVEDAQPVVEGDVDAGAGADAESLHVAGVDTLQPGALPASGPAVDPYLLIGERGALVSQRVATRYGLKGGGGFPVIADGRPVVLRVAAILPPEVAVDSSVVFVDVATAQELFDKLGRLDRIDVVVQPAQLDAVRRRLAALAPPGARVVTPAARDAELRRLLHSFQLNLTVLSYIALLVAASLVYNAVAISVVQRREEIGILRALGAGRTQIFAAFLLEGAGFGLVGSLIGVELGAFLAGLSVQAVARTVSTLYAATHVDHVVYDPAVLLRAFAIGVALAIASAALPAILAAREPPVRSMRSRGAERRVRAGGAAWFVAALIAFALAAVAARLPALDGIPIFGYVAALAVLAGGALCVLPGLLGATRLVALARMPLTARLGAGELGTSPRRASIAIASLMVAVATMVSVATLIDSLRTTVVAWSEDTIRADLYVSPAGAGDATLPAATVARIGAVAGVAAVDTIRTIDVPFRGSLTTLAAVRAREFGARDRLRVLAGAPAATLARTMPGTTLVSVSQPLAERFGVRPGDAIPLATPSGPATLRVAAIFSDYSSDGGLIFIDAGTFARLFGDTKVNSVAIYARDGGDLGTIRSAIVRAAAPQRLVVETTRELRALVTTIFDRTFAITYALYGIALTIALLGVVGTLFALVLERRREIGILRYIGLTRGGVRAMVFAEAAVIGALGAAYGAAVGLVLALVLIFVIDRQSFGWVIGLHVPWLTLGQGLALVLCAALLGGLYPARVAARIRADEAVRSE
jgi:putative ABC transport system permease protein